MLDEFSATEVDEKSPSVAKTAIPPKQPERNHESPENLIADEFNKQLQEQMAALMGSTDGSPEMKREIENIMKELGAVAAEQDTSSQGQAAPPPPTAATSGVDAKGRQAGGTATSDTAFQETIRKTMERMQASGDQASASSTMNDNNNNPDDILAQLLRDMPADEGADNEEGFNKILLGMMEQMTSKEILYEPMKDLHEQYPAWLAQHGAATKPEDLRRYEEQQRLVKQIVERFERKGYADENPADREFVVERMQQVSAKEYSFISFCRKWISGLSSLEEEWSMLMYAYDFDTTDAGRWQSAVRSGREYAGHPGRNRVRMCPTMNRKIRFCN